MLLSLFACSYFIEFDDKGSGDTALPDDGDADTDADADADADADTDADSDTDTDVMPTTDTEWALPDGQTSLWVWAHDITGDGEDDLISVTRPSSPQSLADLVGTIHVIRAAGGDLYYPRVELPVGHLLLWGLDASFGDLNEDGYDDMALGHQDGFTVFLGSPTGLSGTVEVATDITPGPVLADVDLDGHLDVSGTTGEAGEFVVWSGDGAGGLARSQSTTSVPAPEQPRAAVADLDGDGWPDHIRRLYFYDDAPESIEVFWNNAGTFAPGVRYGYPDGDALQAADAVPWDLAVIEPPEATLPIVVLPAAWPNDVMAGYSFADRAIWHASGGWAGTEVRSANALLVGDADGNGTPDLLVPYYVGESGSDGNAAEVAFFSSFGGSYPAYYRGEWELKNMMSTSADHGYALIGSAERDGLRPMATIAYYDYLRCAIRITEAEAEL